MTDNFADKLNAARSRIAASLLPKISSAVAASSASKLTATPMGNNLKEHIANGGQPTNDMINYFNDKTIADGVNRQNVSDAQQNDYFGVSTANITSPNVFMAAAANAVNLAGGAVGTLAQWGNTLAGDEFTAQAIAMEAGTPAHVVDAYNALNRTREKKKQLAEQSRVIREQIRNKQGDPIQLNAQLLAIETAYKGIQVDPNVMNTLSVKNGDTTYLEKLDASQELRHKGARVTAGSGEGFMPAMKSSDFSNPYYKKPLEQANKGDQFIINTNALADRQLDEGTLTGTLQGIGNKVLATGKSIGNVLAAGVDNPTGVLQYTAESAPYFALPGIGTIAIVNQTAVEGRHKFEERTGQALPTTGQNAAMLATDALYGALNYIGDKGVQTALRGTTAAPVRSSSQVLLDAARGVGSTGLRAAGKEGLAEGAQTYLEESGQNLGTYFNPDTVGQAAAIGALSSGVVSTPADLKHGVKNYKINKFLNSPAGQEALAQVEKQKVLDAIPLAELQNPTSANHNPVEAINRMTTGVTEATKDTVIKDVSALVNNLQDVVTERETNLANAELRVAEANKNIPIIDQLIASGNTDPALVDARKTYTDFLEGDGSPQRIKEQQDAVEAANSELINAHEHAKIKLKAVRDAFGVANPNTAPTVSVPTFNAANPDMGTGGTVYPYPSKDAGVRAALESSDVTKNYTPEQREVLRVFSEAVVLIHSTKELKDVSIDIKQGGNTGGQKYRGLEQYMALVTEAINNGNVRSQQYYFRSLAKFSQSHTSKAQKFQEALDAYTPGMVKIVQKNDDTNLWEIMDTVTEEVFNAGNFKKDLRKTGGFGIHNNSAELVAKVQIEADGIAKVLEAIDVMVNGSQSVAPTEPPVAVPATPTPAVPASVVAPTPPVVTEPLNDTDTEVKNKILSEYPIERLVYGGRSRTAQNAIKAQDLKAMKKAYNLLKAEEQIKLLEANNKKIETELAVKRELFRKTKATKVGDTVTVLNDEEGGGEYRAKILELTKYKTTALLKIKVVKSGKEYNISVDQYGNTRTGNIKNFVFEAEAPETRPQLLEEINNLKAQIQEVKDTSDYYVDYFKEGSNAPIVTEPSDTTPVDITPAPEAPIADRREILLKLRKRANELVALADVNKQAVTESEYADEWQALDALTSPILSDENILDHSDSIVRLASQRNDPSITQLANEILKEAHARVTKDQEKKAAAGQHTSFRKVDDPKRAAHQAKLDESRIFAEESMKKGLQSIDKLEELLQGKKPVSPVEVKSEPVVAKEVSVKQEQPVTDTTPSDTVSIDKLEATVKSFVKVRDITSEEYKQGTATVYEKQWFKVKTAYNNTVRRLVELVSKGVTTVEDVAALTDILNKLYEFAEQTIDLTSDRAALDKLTQRIDSLATALFSDVSPEIIDAYLKGKTESTERRGDKLTTDRDGAKSFDGRTIEYAFNAPHLQETNTPTPKQTAPVVETKAAPKIGDTSTVVKGRFTITKTVVSDNTVLSVHTNNEDGKVTKSEYVTTYPDIYSDELGDKYTVVIYRDSANPSVITDVKSFDPKDKKNSIGSYGKQGNQTDEQYVTTFTEDGDVTLEYTDKFEKPLAKVISVKQAPETVEGLVKEYGYLGELLADEDVDKVFKQGVEKILELKADTVHTKQSSFSSFVDLLASDGGVEYFTRLAKNDPNISKLTNAANKLHNLMRLAQHITVLNNYHQGDRSINLKEYLDTRPELKSIFEEIRDLKTGHTLVSVIVDLQEAKDVLRSETEKLVTLVGLMYIQAAFEKGQQYLIDTNYADLDEVIFQYTLGLSSHKLVGQLQKHKVVGNDSKGVRELITPTELSFLDKIDGVPVGELSKEDFEMVKALVQNRVNSYFNQYEVLEYPRRPGKVYSQIVHDIIVEHLPKEGFTLENFTPEEVINGAVPESFIWDFKKKAPETTEGTGKDTKADLILPIGTSGSGKSTWIKSVNSEGDYTVISLDDLRIEMTGDIDNKTSDEAVYTEAVNRAVAAVKVGKQVIFDTTNLKKDRRAVIIDAIRKAKPNANIQYKLLPLDPALAKQRIKDALAKGEARANVSDATIDRHAASYTQALEDIKQEGITAFPEIADSNKIGLALQGYTNHSGGAKGYDAEWDIIGAEFGFTNNRHYLLPVDGEVADPRLKAKGVKPIDASKDVGQVAATGTATGEAQIAVTKAERAMGRIEKTHTTRNTKKIRNYAQVKNADGIFAIGSLIPKGAEITIAQGNAVRVALVPQVNGGTSVAVQLGIMMDKPTYVFNQVSNDTYVEGWYKWDKSKQDFVPVEAPILTKNFAGIGTSSNTTLQGKQAIKDVYVKTLASLKPKVEPKDKATFPISEESKTIYGKLGNKTVSGNVVINKVYQLAGVAYAKSIGAIFSLRVDNSNKHFGNPFSSVTSEIAKGLVATKNTKESVVSYIDWVLSETTTVKPEQHAWIREQLKSGNLKGKQIVYYKELGEPSHATALDYLINKYDWGTKPASTTIPVTPKDTTEVVVTPESIVPITPPDSETGDVEIQEDVSSFPEVAEPKEKVTPEGGLSILSIPEGLFVPEGISPVKANMKAEQEKAADQILRAGSTIVIDRSKVDKEDGRAWLAKVATTTKEIITTGIQRANLVVASFYQKFKAPSKLVQVKDFAAKVLAMSPAEQAQMLSEALGETATDSQVQFLENFLMFDKSLRGTMDAMAVPSGQDGFRFKDYLQYLYTDIKSETKTVKILNKKTKTLEDVDQVITTGTLDENVKTAISLGIHTFLIEKTGQFTLDHEGVAELLGIKNTKSVPPEIHRMFRSIGNTQPNVVKYLGTKAYQALQLSMDPNVPTQRKESLINALGSLAVQTMLKEGLLQYTRISNDTILNAKAAIKGETNTVNPSKSFTLYLRPTYDTKKTRGKDGWVYETEPKPIPKIEAIKLSAKGNTKVMSALFSIDGRDVLPMLKKPTKFTQDTLSKTGNEVPDATADLVLQMMQKAYNVNGYTYSAMKTLFETDPDALYAMVGVVSDEDVAKQHISIRGATESKNEALKRSVVNGLDFIDSLTPDEDGNFPDYYLPMSVWSVNRVGVTSNLFNEQGDKVHRALTTMTAHKQQVTISPVVDSDNKLTQYGRFLTGVAAYMEGIKINGKTVDKTDGVSFLPGFERFIETPVMQAAIKAVGSMVMGSATDAEVQLVKDMVISLEGGAMSLTSLIALYEASQAVDGVFTTSMSTGSDGVTNGMALSLLMYDAASLSEDFVAAMTWKEKDAFNKASPKAKEAILQAKKDAFDLANPKDTKGMTKAEKDAFNAGGIFFEGDSVDSMVKFRKSGKADLYEQLAKVQKDLLQKYVQDNKGNTVRLSFITAMNNIDPTFGTRAGAKVSLVPFVYGSGFRSIGAAQSRAFMEEFYKALTKAKLSKDANKIRQFQANYVALAQAVGTPREEIIDFVKLTVQGALDTELTLKQIKAITGLENKIRSQITEEALTQVAGTLIQSRKRVSGLANVGFESYNRLYRALYDQAYAKLAEGKFLPYRIGTSGSLIGEKIVVEGMSVSQNQKVNDELKDFTPQIYSVGGVFSTNGERSAHSMWSEDQIQDPTDTGTTNPTFGATTEGKALPTPNSDGAIFPSKSITTNLHIRSVKSRGAATNAAVVQAMDAWITAKVSAAMDTFNHHDENVSAIDKAAEMGQLQNKTLFNAVLDYDVYLKVLHGSLLRPLRGIIKLSKRDDTLAIAKEEVGKVMADLKQYMDANFGGFNEDMGMLASLVHEMYSLEIAKLTKYKNLKSISQYGIEGGEYIVTKKDVARINDLIASHVASRTALLKEVAKISADLKAIGAKPKAEPVVTAPEPEKQTSKVEPKKEVSVPVVYSKDGDGSFQGFVGGFSDSGKGTITGDGKDVAMRKVATSFIGEVSNIKGSSSTHTSATEIAAKTADDVEYAQEQSHTPSTSPTIYTINYTPNGGNVTMLARNGSLKGKPLDEVTKEIIYEVMLAGESFIVGDMPGVDSQFVEFLNEIGANFKIYHTGKTARIQGKDINPDQIDTFAQPETKEEAPKGKPASVDSFIVRDADGVVDTLATLNSMPINDSTLVGKVIKQVVEALKGKLPANLKVHMITGSNLPTALDKENVKDTLSRGSAGVTYSIGNTHTIGLVEGKASMITFIHELIHAFTVSALSGTSAKARKLKFNISLLRKAALAAYREYTDSLDPVLKLDAERRDKVYMDAFNSEGDKDAEFVAMATSEPAIIAFLATVPAPKLSAIDTGLISIFSAFIKSVGEFLGVVKNAQGKDVESVLEAMVRQTAHLMNINDQSSASEQINNYPGQQAAVDAVRLIREYPSKEVFNVLPASLDVGFDTYLSSLMDTIVDKTFNHLSFPSTTYTPLEVWENAITDGRTPYTTRAVAAGYVLSERELFAIETLEVALKGAMDAGITTPVYKEMERAYESARKTLKPESFYNGDWSTALESDREIARNKYKHLFKMEGGQATRSDYMSRFMAMALASSEVNSLLGFPTLTEARVDGTIFSKILAYYEYAMDWVSGHLTGTMRYQTINSKLPTLAQKLVDIDHKKRDQALSSVYDTVSDNLDKANKYIKESGGALADRLENMIGDSKKGLPSAARTASRVVLRGAAMDMLKVAKIWRDMSAPNTVLGWKGELLNELSDPSSIGQAVRSLLRIHTRLQTERKTHKSTTKESILSNFLNGGKNLSKDDHSAITYGVLRGDLKALYDLHGIRGIEKLLNNSDEVESEVARLEGLITNETHIVRAKDLAHYMTSGEVNLMLAKNALSIARDVGLPTVLEEDMVSEEDVSNIDMLVSLYAIQYMKSSHLQTLQKLFKQEGARTDGNGLAALMKYHQAIEQEAKDTLFEGNSVSIIKGYTPEITNPHREIKIVTLASDAKHLEAMGYQLHSILSADPNDVNQAKRMMYFTEEPSTQRFVTGAMSLTADSSKGTSIIDGSSLSVKDKISALKSITTRSATKLKAKSAKDYDPTNIKNRGISPTYSNLGSIQDFRYEMTHATRDGLLQRNNNFAEIMGTYAGSNFDKASTPKHNETVIDALYKDYKENYLKDPRAYVMIGKDSTDPRAVEMYAMLPYKTRKYIDKVWGKREPMWVRNDALLATFGTNKYSIGEAFEKNPDARNIVEKTIVDMFKVLFGDTAKLRALQGERLNQELVSWYKSTIVIRNLTTLMGNQSANVGVLLTMGVSPVDIIKDSLTAFKAGNRFRKDNTELVRVENNMKAGVGNFEDNVQLQARLKDSIARNPLKQFLDAGMLNTIVEDVSLDVEDYNYKSKLAQQLDDQLDKLNPTVRKIGANLVVAPSTELYQVLANATQLSDFTAKYTLYKHLTTKAKDKLSHEDALAMADRMFINYDVPTSKELQYANDMGFLMFTKYTLRIQRAIAYLLKERKASLLAQGMLGTALGMPLATAPAFFNVMGNPLHPGALMVPGALTQPLPIKVLSGGF